MARRKSTRVGSVPDTSRLAEVFSVPGIDPRRWICLAVVDDVFVDRDEDNGEAGIFADVILLPSEEPQTALVGAAFTFNGGGLYAPPQEGEMVLVAAIEGDPDFGFVIIAQVGMIPDVPPVEADAGDGEPSPDVILIARKDARVRIISDGGEVFIEARNSTVRVEADTVTVEADKVQLGKDNLVAPNGVVHGSGIDSFTGATYTALGSTSLKVFAEK